MVNKEEPGGQLRWLERVLRWVTHEREAESIAGDLEEERLARFSNEAWLRSRMWILRVLPGILVSKTWQSIHRTMARRRRKPSVCGRAGAGKAQGGSETMLGWFSDLRLAIRGWSRQPRLGLIALAVLVLGLTATTVFFGLVQSILLRPLPFPNAERLVRIYEVPPREGAPLESLSPPNYFDWKEQSKTLSDIAAYWTPNLTITGDGDPEKLLAATVSANLLDVLQRRPQIGRAFTLEDDTPGAPPVSLLSDRLWRTRYGGEPEVIGKTIILNDRPVEVIGVMPPSFDFPAPGTSLWIPLQQPRTREARGGVPYRGFRILNTVGRLENGVSIDSASSEFDRLSRQASERYPQTNERYGAELVSLRADRVSTHRRSLLVLFGAVISVLFVACGNLGTLMAARSATRFKELNIRRSLGASHFRLARMLMTEILVLAGAGGFIAVTLSASALNRASVWLPSSLPRLGEVRFDLLTFGFAMFISIVAAMVASSLPFVQWFRRSAPLGRVTSTSALVRTRTGIDGSSHGVIIVAQVAASLVLLVGASLFLRSLNHLSETDTGFRRNNVLYTLVELPFSRFRDHHRRVDFFDRLRELSLTLPGVDNAGISLGLPIDPRAEFFVTRSGIRIEGHTTMTPSERPLAALHVVGVGAFETLGIPLVEGRSFDESDDQESEPVVIINSRLARQYWPGQNPIGKHLTHDLTLIPGDENVRRVVGVVGDSRYYSLDKTPEPQTYIPHRQTSWPQMHLLLQTSRSPEALSGELRELLWSIDPDVPTPTLRSLESIVSGAVASPRMRARLSVAFAFAALALAGLGLYGVIASSVQQRRAEIGLRMALGASMGSVVWLFMSRGLRWTILGLIAGIAGSLLVGRTLASLLYGVSPNDAFSLLVTSGLALSVAAVAVYIPSRRAARTDPVSVLRIG